MKMKQGLFEEYPCLKDDRVMLRKMTAEDADDLQRFADNALVYRDLPTFLYEQKYRDKKLVIQRMDEECFRTGQSILLAICLTEDPSHLIGIAEIYNFEENKAKASIGCRLDDRYWGQGIASSTIRLMRDWLIHEIGLRTITAHIMKENRASAKAAAKNGFVCKYPDLYGDWGFEDLSLMDKYVFKGDWLSAEDGSRKLPPVHVEQFVMAYGIEQDRIRAMLPEGYESLRPVLRINAEIRNESIVYVEFNTPVEADGRRGWLNIDNWKSSSEEHLHFTRSDGTVTITAPFLELSYTGVGITGGCPAEKDNDGCYFIHKGETEFRPAEKITENKEFCDCCFAWHFHEGDAAGESTGETLPAFHEPEQNQYQHCQLTAERAAAIPCRKVLGSYIVRFSRYID